MYCTELFLSNPIEQYVKLAKIIDGLDAYDVGSSSKIEDLFTKSMGQEQGRFFLVQINKFGKNIIHHL